MINPGLIYILAAPLFYLLGNKKRKYLSFLIPAIVLVIIYILPADANLSYRYLNVQLIFLTVNPVNKLIAAVFTIFSLGGMFYSFGLASKKFYVFSCLYIGSSIAILFVGDYLSFFLFWELMTITSFFLIYSKKRPFCRSTSIYYFLMHMVGGISLMWAILLQYNHTGSLLLTSASRGLPFFLLAIGIKLAFIGLHTWLPLNYAAVPFYISVILSAYTTKIGVYGFYKIIGNINLTYIGIITALIGVILALKQNRIRRLLAYHLISQIGYMITGLALGDRLGTAGGFLHLINNVLYKGLLFMVAGVIIYTTGRERLSQLGGLAKKLPFTAGTGLLASLAIAGFPFLNGYISKLILKKAVLSYDLYTVKYGLSLAGIGTSLSFIKFMYYTFWHQGETSLLRKPKKSMQLGMSLLLLFILIISFSPFLIENYFSLNSGIKYFSPASLWGGLQPILIAAVIFILMKRYLLKFQNIQFGKDIYHYLTAAFTTTGKRLSSFHTGDLVRYLLWLLSFLVFLWLNFTVLRG